MRLHRSGQTRSEDTMKSHVLAALAAGLVAAPLARADTPPPTPTPTDNPENPPDTPQPPPVVETVPPPPAPPQTVVISPEPPRATYVERTDVVQSFNAPLFGTGLATFAVGYGAAVIGAATSDDSDSLNRLYVPVAGPWLALDQRPDCPIERARCDRETSTKALLVTDGVIQAAGVITMAVALIMPREHTVVHREDAGVRVGVVGSPRLTGVAVSGTF